MSQFSVTFQQISSTIEQLTELNSRLKTAANSLESTEAQLCGMWEGKAKDTFDQAFKSDKIQMDNFYNAIQQYISALQTALQKYQQAESENAETAQTRKYR